MVAHVGGDGALLLRVQGRVDARMAGPDGGPEGRGLERACKPTPAVERTPAQHPVSWGSSGAPDPGGPQSLAGPPALLDSAGRSGLLRCASARSPAHGDEQAGLRGRPLSVASSNVQFSLVTGGVRASP